MINHLEYSELEIDSAFTDIVNGEATVEDLCDILGIELSPTILDQAQLKVSKWESALFVIKMKQGA